MSVERLTNCIEVIKECTTNLNNLITDYLENKHSKESAQRKKAFRNSILSLIHSEYHESKPLSAKEWVTSSHVNNLPIKEALLVASSICFGEATMEEARIWEEHFKDVFSEDNPKDIEEYIAILNLN